MGTWKAFSTLESCLFRSRLRYSEKEGGLYCACLTYAIFYFWINRALQLPVFFWSISLHKGCIQQIGHTVSICALFLFLSISLISFCKPPRGLYIFNCRSHLSLFLPFLVHEMKKKKKRRSLLIFLLLDTVWVKDLYPIPKIAFWQEPFSQNQAAGSCKSV